MNASALTRSVCISDVFCALGGQKPRRDGRTRAFWRNGDGYSIALNDERNSWRDFRDSVGGGVIDLIQLVNGGSRLDALHWLADFAGEKLDSLADRRAFAYRARIREDARYFADAARVMAEVELESLGPNDIRRRNYTGLISALRDPEVEYVAWMERDSGLAAALVHAGRERELRMQRMLAGWIGKISTGKISEVSQETGRAA